jgi:hypothetical protein
MEHIAPLIQTVLWVSLIAGIVWRFNKPIFDLLVALNKRVTAGSTIKAGPFELSDQLKPQDPTKQKEKAESEVRELLQAEEETDTSQPVKNVATIQARYFQAEDLTLRALQAEYGITISRQLTAGADMGFDGVFVIKGQLTIIEVKYFTGKISTNKLRHSVNRITTAIERYGWGNVRIILAVVFENAEDIAKLEKRLKEEIIVSSRFWVEVRCYSLKELQENFGVVGENNG